MCPISVTVHEGKVLKVEGDREAPLYGGFSCPKGRALPAQHHAPNRLLHSLKRLPDGRRVPISSDELVEEIAQRLSQIIDAHGPRSVAAFLGGGVMEQPAASGLMLSLLRAIRSPMMFSSGTIDQPGLILAQALHGIWEGGRVHPSQWDVFLVSGGNPVVSKQYLPQNPAQQLKSITKTGTKLIVIDPRRSETARRAAVHLAIIPGEDPTVLAGLIHLIFALDGVDRSFVAENAEGLDELRQVTRAFTPDYVASRAGISEKDLIAAAQILAQSRGGETGLGTGASMATRGTLSSYLALCIQTLRGFWAREGDPIARPRVLLPRHIFKAQPSPPQRAWGFGLQTVRGLQQTVAGMPAAALPELMLSNGNDRVRALFLHGGAMYTWPQQNRTIEALSALDLLVMHDVELTATSAMAHYVIATRKQLEVPAISHFSEVTGRIHHGYDWSEPYAMYQPATVDPPEGSDLMESWQIYYRLAQRLGLELDYVDFTGTSPAPVKIDMDREPTTDDLYELFCRNSVIPLSRVKQYPHGALFDEARDVVRPRDAACSARLQLANPAMMEELRLVRQENILARRKTCPDYPYLLITRRMQNSTNSGGRVDGIIKTGYNPAFMHPADMQQLALVSGSMVEIKSRHGTITGFVEPDADLRPGVVAMTHGFGAQYGKVYDPRRDGANVNQLLSWEDDNDPYCGIPRMSAVPIAVEAVPDDAQHELRDEVA
jgi:anaerobic selenocysteine-containing dehydrogenase